MNQSSKLFDKKVIDNILYGCMDKEVCNKYLDKLMKYPKINELYKNIDIYTNNQVNWEKICLVVKDKLSI